MTQNYKKTQKCKRFIIIKCLKNKKRGKINKLKNNKYTQNNGKTQNCKSFKKRLENIKKESELYKYLKTINKLKLKKHSENNKNTLDYKRLKIIYGVLGITMAALN